MLRSAVFSAAVLLLLVPPAGAGDPNDNWWDGFDQWPNGQGLRDDVFYPVVNALQTYNGELIAGGNFDEAGDKMVKNIARWNGANWRKVGPVGVSGVVEDFAVFEDDLIVGGFFLLAGSVPAWHIVRWNEDDDPRWTALASGFNSTVRAVEVYNGELYAGGGFTASGSTPINGLARWDGAAWQPVAGGVTWDNLSEPGVWGMTVHDGKLIVGGWFQMADGDSANGVAAWDGMNLTTRSGLGEDVYEPLIEDFVVHEGDLFALGNFTASIEGLQGIARWDGAQWQPFAGGLNGPGSDGLSIGSDLYVAGQFSLAGGDSAHRVARWDGTSWNALGSGLDDGLSRGNALEEFGGDVFVGTNTYGAGGKPSYGIARWMPNGGTTSVVSAEQPASLQLLPSAPNPFTETTAIRFDLGRRQEVRLSIHDVTGRLVRSLDRSSRNAGAHAVSWDGRDDGGRSVASGVYFVRLDAKSDARTQRIVRLRD